MFPLVGPATTFLIADLVSIDAVFYAALILSFIWLGLWCLGLPIDITAGSQPKSDTQKAPAVSENGLWFAIIFIFCLSLAHSLTFSSLLLFYVQEVQLSGFVPGVAFSMKTFVEVIAILLTPAIVWRFGMRPTLRATALLAVVTILLLSSVRSLSQMLFFAALEGLYYGLYASIGISYVQSFAMGRPARATALYWNTLMITGLLAGPAVGFIAQAYDFQTVIQIASIVALSAAVVLVVSRASSREYTNKAL